jgi:hypothetical protein
MDTPENPEGEDLSSSAFLTAEEDSTVYELDGMEGTAEPEVHPASNRDEPSSSTSPSCE